ncbi:TetR family transcriptional regulator [Arthrobacter mangrovi]|uniref:Transcriptional regulator, TetR family protein n=1 Tax=Arthrobacter mangrovi TaxID=2966350 RepID=A0ABQ5MUR6_9MICC|nr:TetR family transcriptional regulator [Arthrobacter mangrovi]GLB67713.1 putative transcriptional regulator, TetR family protein [Arthrobacter mangrovi]
MALTRRQIEDAAMQILRSYGLADLSMRRLARDLGVQPGALYWHVKNKQELLGVLARQILAAVPEPDADHPDGPEGEVSGAAADTGSPIGGPEPVRQLALDIRSALLSVRDGADVVSLAQAMTSEALPAISTLRRLLERRGLGAQPAAWGARTLTHCILGSVAEEQTHADLAAAGLLPEGAERNNDDEAFLFGVDTVLAGLGLAARA